VILTEVKKGELEIQRGMVMMAIEGDEPDVMKVARELKSAGYGFTDCAEESDDGERYVVFFVVDRRDIKLFRADYRTAKAALTTIDASS
jgi:uncharacterized protein YebE (UPF0316 family)